MASGTGRRWLLLFVLAVSAASGAADTDSSSSGDAPPLSSMDVYDVLGLLFMACGLTLSSAGGVGGGVIMVPAMVLIMGFDIKVATPISNMGILGGAIANGWFNIRKRHPAVDRPLIDADLTLLMVPVVIGGAVIGAVMANLLPSYLLSLLLVVVLVAGNSRMLVKGIAMHKKEVAARKEASQVHQDGESPASPAAEYSNAASPAVHLMVVEKQSGTSRDSPSPANGDAQGVGDLAAILQSEKRFSWSKHGAVAGCYMIVIAASIADTLVTCGGVTYWVLLLAEIPCVALFAVFAAKHVLAEYRTKVQANYPFVDGDVRWNEKVVVWFPLGCVLAGIVAGMFGVGGAVVTGPMLIEMGVVPEVLSATSALMVLYSSAAATAKFAVFGMIAWDWAALLSALAFVVTSVSQIFILGYVRRTGRQSIIILCIVTAALTGTALMAYQAIKTTIDQAGAPFSVDVCD